MVNWHWTWILEVQKFRRRKLKGRKPFGGKTMARHKGPMKVEEKKQVGMHRPSAGRGRSRALTTQSSSDTSPWCRLTPWFSQVNCQKTEVPRPWLLPGFLSQASLVLPSVRKLPQTLLLTLRCLDSSSPREASISRPAPFLLSALRGQSSSPGSSSDKPSPSPGCAESGLSSTASGLE